MKKRKWIRLSAVVGSLLISTVSPAQLLKGVIKADSIPTLQIAYTPDGDLLNMSYVEIMPDEDGNFSFDTKIPTQTTDIGIYLGDGIFGAHLEKGRTTQIYLDKGSDNKGFGAKFKGDNVELSEFYSAYVKAFDIMKYFSPDPEKSKSTQEYRDILENEYAVLKKELVTIKDEQWRSYYTKLSEGMYTWTKIRIIMDDAENENKSVRQYPEYNSLISTINPNDGINIPSNLIFAWLGGSTKHSLETKGDNTLYYIECMELVDNEITDPTVRACLTRYIAHTYFSYGSGEGDVNEFWTRYKVFAKDYPELVARYELQVKSISGTEAGSEIPYDPTLATVNGTTCKLSDLSGSFLYIDVWATWCVPCVKEIPYLEEVAEHFEGNDKIKIISVSVDQNREAWLKKLERDKPDWGQYILSPEEAQKFMKAWGIGGIPRFIMINKEGRIFSADAQRPSSEELIGILESQL